MNKEVEEKRRELFNEWLSAQACHGVFMGGYTMEEEAGAWAAFNFALDLVVIKLPAYHDPAQVKARPFSSGFNCGLGHAVNAINQTGLGLKVSE